MADISEHLELRGEVGALIGSRDWSKTPLGPLEGWPSSLKTMIGVMLGSRFPMMLGWGPDLLQFYNDACLPVLGVKHPDSLGAPVSAVWSEIWTIVGPMFRGSGTPPSRPLRTSYEKVELVSVLACQAAGNCAAPGSAGTMPTSESPV